MTEETKTPKSKLKANKRYNQKNIFRFTLQLNRKTDADIIQYLSTKKNKNGYIKEIIRIDMDAMSEYVEAYMEAMDEESYNEDIE